MLRKSRAAMLAALSLALALSLTACGGPSSYTLRQELEQLREKS